VSKFVTATSSERWCAALLVTAWCLAAPVVALAQQPPLRVALTGKYPPFSYYEQQGQLAGFDVDVSREIAKRLGREIEIVATEWDGILAGLLADKYDAIIGSMAVTPERAGKVSFSEPYYRSGAQLFVHRDNPGMVYSIDECGGCKVAVVLGETFQQYLERNYPEVEVVTLESSVEIFKLLEQHRITGFVSDRLVGAYQIKIADRPFVPVGDMLYAEEMAIPVRKENAKLLADINDALRQMREDGTMRRIHQQYFGLSAVAARQTGRMSTKIIAEKLARGFAITLGIAAAALAIGFVLAVPCGLILNHRHGGRLFYLIVYLPVRTIIDFLRGTPVLIQLLFAWLGLGLSPPVAAIGTLGVNAMAYMSEVVRAGLMSVDQGQIRAGRALALGRWQVFRYVVWPQAFRVAMPPLMNSVVALTKDTALVSIISVAEVIREARTIISVTFEPTKYYFIVAVMFFAVTFPLMKIAGRMERKIREKGYSHD